MPKHKRTFVPKGRASGSLLYSPESLLCGVGRWWDRKKTRLCAWLTSGWVAGFSSGLPRGNHTLDQQLLFHFLVPWELLPLTWHEALSLSAFQIVRIQKLFTLFPQVSPLVGTGGVVCRPLNPESGSPLGTSRTDLPNFSGPFWAVWTHAPFRCCFWFSSLFWSNGLVSSIFRLSHGIPGSKEVPWAAKESLFTLVLQPTLLKKKCELHPTFREVRNVYVHFKNKFKTSTHVTFTRSRNRMLPVP